MNKPILRTSPILAGVAILNILLALPAEAQILSVQNGPINSTATWASSSQWDLDSDYRVRHVVTATTGDNINFIASTASGRRVFLGDGAATSGTISMNGGTVNLNGGLRVGSNSTGTGTVLLNGGTLNIDNDLEIARFNDGATGTVTVAGGDLSVTGNILVGSQSLASETAVFNYSGGSVSTASQFQLQNGTLNFTYGAGPIIASQRTGATSGPGALIALDLGTGYTHNIGSSFRFIESNSQSGVFTLQSDLGGVTMNNGALATIGGYQFEIDRVDGASGYLGLTAVPEPSSVLLLGLGCAMLACKRRRR